MAKKNIPSSNHTQVEVQQKNTELHAGIYQGPLPLPSIMEGYKNIDSSFPERIMKEFEKIQIIIERERNERKSMQ